MTGVIRRIGRARGLIALVAVVTCMVLVTGLVGEAAAAVRPSLSERGRESRPEPQQSTRVKGREVKAAQEK
ncbi:hypothetical protein ACFQ07_28900, partial [Actinomadura adrarensis]